MSTYSTSSGQPEPILVQRPKRSNIDVLSSIDELEHLRKYLDDQFDEMSTRYSSHCDESSIEYSDVSALLNKNHEHMVSTIKALSNNVVKEDVIKCLLHSQEVFKAVHSELFTAQPADPDLSIELKNEIKGDLIKLLRLNEWMSKSKSRLYELGNEKYDLSLSLQGTLWQNQESLEMLKHVTEERNQDKLKNQCELQYTEVKEARIKFEKEVKRLRIVKHVFQAVIHSSKLDWYKDEELCDLMVSLGELTIPVADVRSSDVMQAD